MENNRLTFKSIFVIFMLPLFPTISGSNDSLDRTPMKAPKESKFNHADPTGQLATLSFRNDEEATSYEAMLDTMTTNALEQQLKAFGVYTEDSAVNRGIFITWCKIIGNDELASKDHASCQRGLTYGIKAPGTNALQLFARRDTTNAPVDTFGQLSISVPNVGETGWRFIYQRNLGSEDNFSALFTLFDGRKVDRSVSISLRGNYKYEDNNIDLSEIYLPTEPVNSLLNQFRESQKRFYSIVSTHNQSLLMQVEAAIEDKNVLSNTQKSNALVRARTEIAQRMSLFNENSTALHVLLVKHLSLNLCE